VPNVDEIMGASGSMAAAALAAGLDAVSLSQEVTFSRYLRLVLPMDGFIFWVRTSLVSPMSLYNDIKYNEVQYNLSSKVSVNPNDSIQAKGSLHYTSVLMQEADESYTNNQVIFTSETEINDLNDNDPSSIFVGSIDRIRFAFRQRTKFFRQNGLYHYVGDAIVPVMHLQLIEDPREVDARPVVSNSLPIWLRLAAAPPYVWQQPRQLFPLFPSFVVPDNLETPYGSVHIYPESTMGIALPSISASSSHSQFAKDKVRITFFGLRSDAVIDFLDAAIDYMTNFDDLGLINIPIIKDEKRTKPEMR
jgi:hypothetical protein